MVAMSKKEETGIAVLDDKKYVYCDIKVVSTDSSSCLINVNLNGWPALFRSKQLSI